MCPTVCVLLCLSVQGSRYQSRPHPFLHDNSGQASASSANSYHHTLTYSTVCPRKHKLQAWHKYVRGMGLVERASQTRVSALPATARLGENLCVHNICLNALVTTK